MCPLLHYTFGDTIRVFKNNTDLDGHTFGCHENYSLDPKVFNGERLSKLLTFLATRQIFTGAGKINNGVYELSQRSAHMNCSFNWGTTDKKPIINMRDEPFAVRYKRLHLICGDANMSEMATYLKLGTTAIVLDLLEDGVIPEINLVDPVNEVRALSRDQTYSWVVKIKRRFYETGKTMRAVDIQREYLKAAQKYVKSDPITDDLLKKWEYVLDQLERDPMGLSNWIDWVAKRHLFGLVMQERKMGISDPLLEDIDLQYHELDRYNSLFYKLQELGSIERLVTDIEIEEATKNPPKDTRAFFRGNFVRARANRIRTKMDSVNWDRFSIGSDTTSLLDPFDRYERHLIKLEIEPK
ncbi:MAG: proteasome accessory factor PafA2 family protein [Candidatus Aenigmarchaeota archaeon]|nr:proteasome accessory factor PafA2 family protein [Candidatus Aenigmarchaeota archaeon]